MASSTLGRLLERFTGGDRETRSVGGDCCTPAAAADREDGSDDGCC